MPFQINNLSAGLTRPNDTTAYAAGDLVANATTAGAVVPLQIELGNIAAVGHGMTRITRARLTKSGTSPTNANFRIHLYEAAFVPQNGDNGAWLTDHAASWQHRRYFDARLHRRLHRYRFGARRFGDAP